MHPRDKKISWTFVTYWTPPPWPSLSLLILVGPSSTRLVCKSNITFQPKSPKTKHTKQHRSDIFYPSKTHTTKFLNSFLSPFLLFLVSFICALSLSNGVGLGLLQFCSEGYGQEWWGLLHGFAIWVATKHEHHRNQIVPMSSSIAPWVELDCNGFGLIGLLWDLMDFSFMIKFKYGW